MGRWFLIFAVGAAIATPAVAQRAAGSSHGGSSFGGSHAASAPAGGGPHFSSSIGTGRSGGTGPVRYAPSAPRAGSPALAPRYGGGMPRYGSPRPPVARSSYGPHSPAEQARHESEDSATSRSRASSRGAEPNARTFSASGHVGSASSHRVNGNGNHNGNGDRGRNRGRLGLYAYGAPISPLGWWLGPYQFYPWLDADLSYDYWHDTGDTDTAIATASTGADMVGDAPPPPYPNGDTTGGEGQPEDDNAPASWTASQVDTGAPALTLVYKNGKTEQVTNYVISPTSITVIDSAGVRGVPLTGLDLDAMRKANAGAGLQLPHGQ